MVLHRKKGHPNRACVCPEALPSDEDLGICVRQTCEAEAIDWECIARAALAGLRFLHTQGWVQGLVVTHADLRIRMMAQALPYGMSAFIVWGMHQVLWMESQDRVPMAAARLLALHDMLHVGSLHGTVHRSGGGRCAALHGVGGGGCTLRPC